MAQRITYVAVNWKNRVVQRPRTYTETTNQDGSRTDTPAPGTVVQAGTPINQANLNKMEKGIVDCVEAINDITGNEVAKLKDHENRISNNERAIRDLQDRYEAQSTVIRDLSNEIERDFSIVQLPAALVEIDEQAFYGRAFTLVIAGDRLQSILSKAFAYCINMRLISLPSAVNFIADDAFLGCINLTILAPSGSYAARWAAAKGFPVDYP